MSELSTGEAGPTAGADALPKRRPWLKRLLVIGGLVLAILFIGYVGLSFLGAQVADALRGTIEFGTGGSGCSVDGRASTFPLGSFVYVVAYPSRDVAAGEVLTLRVSQDGVEALSQPDTLDTALGKGDCLSGSMPGTAFAPAHYRFEYRAGSETLAAGEFDISP